MVKLRLKPMRSASRRSIRTQAEWNVDTHILRATGPTRAATRFFISSAALFVKVMARISNGDTPRSLISHATRDVSTRVLPDPAPATMSSGPPGWVTASRCTGFRLASRSGGGMETLPAYRPVLAGGDLPAFGQSGVE